MVSGSSNPTVRRLELAARLRDLRLSAGKSLDDVAAELMCSPAKISRLETGDRGIQPRDVRDLCRFYGVPDEERDRLLRLADEARKPGWWHDYRNLDQRASTFVALESAAVDIRFSQAMIIPGLLQTSEYTRSLVSRLRPPGEMSPDVVDEVVRLRAKRQERLLNGEVAFSAVVDEATFRRTVGSAQVMLEQVDRLLELCRLPGVSLQVIPFEAGPHPLLEGSFQHMQLGAPLPDVVFVEGLLGTFIVDDVAQVRAYREIWQALSEKIALTEAATTEWLLTERERWVRLVDEPASERRSM